mgnify:FL=1
MSRNTYFPNENNKPIGFSPAAGVGSLIFVSGQVSVDADGDIVGDGDCGIQSQQCFLNIEKSLIAAGATMVDVVKITAFIVRPDDYTDYGEIRRSWFPNDGPASSSVFISGLVDPKFLIEIEAVAVIGH